MTAPTTAVVVIPAHDEEAVIGRCLDALHRGTEPGEHSESGEHSKLTVVVAANGCTDRTVQIAREHPSRPLVLDLPTPGKPAALNAADAAAPGWPRIYLDADIEVDAATVRALAAVLAADGVLAAAPAPRWRTEECSALVRAYYRVWSRLPVLGEGYVGSGLFGLSRAGHERVAPFPAVVAEDEYVRRSFAAAERGTSPGHFDVRVARTVGALIRRGTRTRSGNQALRNERGLSGNPGGSRAAVLAMARSPRDLPAVLVFAAVTAAVRLRSTARGSAHPWERDETTRQGSAGSPVPRPQDDETFQRPQDDESNHDVNHDGMNHDDRETP